MPSGNAVESQDLTRENGPQSERDQLIRDFLKILKVTFKMSKMYHLEHPAFANTVSDFMAKLDALFAFLNPLSIGFTPHSLFLDGRFWEREKTFIDLAQLFHFRKIKKVEIRQGITLGELTRFAAKITLPLRDFIKEGGAQNILRKEQIIHITVDELDYTQLLRGEGEEIKEIWPYLLMEAVEGDDPIKLDQMAESFEKVAGKFNTEDLIQNEEMQKSFLKFFHYLKATAQEKHRSCAKHLLRSILAGKKTPVEAKFENLRLIISDMNEEDLASTLWEEIIANDRFDSLSFGVFSKIIAKERHKKISTSLRNLFHSDDPLNRRPDVERKLKLLLADRSGQMLSTIYRQTLSALLNEISFEKQLRFDHQLLQRNYRYLLLNLLSRDGQDDEALKRLERISEEWEQITAEKDIEFLGLLLKVLYERAGSLAGQAAYKKVENAISQYVENLILRGETLPELDYFIGHLRERAFDWWVYLDKIFFEKTVTPTLLKGYFEFFPAHLSDFFSRLKSKESDSRLLEKIVESLSAIDSPVALAGLISVYELGEVQVKLRALKAMHRQTELDEPFLFSVLETKNCQLKGEALVLLTRYERAKHVALTKLFHIQSPYGLRNRKLIRHIRMVEEKNLRDAGSFLESLSLKKDFWNKKVRQEALRVLERWAEAC
jgi:hypothetical protein